MERRIKMRMLCSVLVCLVLVSGMVYGQTACIQDQYGDQYNYTVDKATTYVYGTATIAPTFECPGGPWPITGSYVTSTSGNGFELTAANPDPSSITCVPIFTLKGTWPNFDWYYLTGPSVPPQPGTWVPCSKTSVTATGKGPRN
jgi:hypothetical protein